MATLPASYAPNYDGAGMKVLVAAFFLCAHAVAHLVAPHSTTLWFGRLDLGESATRVLGLVWAGLAAAFVVGAVGLCLHADWWRPIVVVTALVSSILCVLTLPEAKWGIPANLVVLGFSLSTLWLRLVALH